MSSHDGSGKPDFTPRKDGSSSSTSEVNQHKMRTKRASLWWCYGIVIKLTGTNTLGGGCDGFPIYGSLHWENDDQPVEWGTRFSDTPRWHNRMWAPPGGSIPVAWSGNKCTRGWYFLTHPHRGTWGMGHNFNIDSTILKKSLGFFQVQWYQILELDPNDSWQSQRFFCGNGKATMIAGSMHLVSPMAEQHSIRHA